jgi:hypothetical protein
MSKGPETDVGRAVVAYLRDMQWEVYQEVSTRHTGAVADIVATLGNLVWVIECKTSLTFEVVAQAIRWRRHGWAHYVSIAVPATKKEGKEFNEGRALAMKVLEREGVGCFKVVAKEGFAYEEATGKMSRPTVFVVQEAAKPSLHRSARYVDQVRGCLREEQKSQIAGSAGGGHWTPFRHTCDQLRRVVKEAPGIAMKDALAKIEHHYHSDASARAALPKWIESGKIDGVCLVIEKRRRRLYPAPEAHS